jgi:xylan 1,4-beta-xylosidase
MINSNPILPGFNPDPSIIRVGEDYYIATSTFEWFPGVQIHHSRDLIHWTLVAQPLNRLSQLDMRGNPDSCGVWAPCLSYDNGKFYLIYSNARRYWSHCKDVHNYIVTSDDICGQWSEPSHLNSSGFDPSLFHDIDGRKWLVNLRWDHRQGRPGTELEPARYFGGIVLQEFDEKSGQLVGPVSHIFSGSALGKSEGPHLYQRNGYYYLIVAEGGTGYEHAITFARSSSLKGPYQIDPQGPMLSTINSDAILQRCGHGDLVDTPAGDSHLVHLCSRPLPESYRDNTGRSVMGRETALQSINWQEGWPRLCHNSDQSNQNNALTQAYSRPSCTQKLDFTQSLPLDFQTLRIPLSPKTLSLTDNPGHLRLYGRESLGSLFEQALIARRQQSFCFTAETCVDFTPNNFQQMAGLVCYYNSSKYYYLYITHDESLGRVLDITSCGGTTAAHYCLDSPVSIPATGTIYLKAEIHYAQLNFFYSIDGKHWKSIADTLDYSILSDEVGEGGEHANFTGSFVGMCCQDLSGTGQAADFASFKYQEQNQ